MAESIFLRVRRVLSANVEDMVDQLERSNSPATMREAVREIDRAADELRGDYEAAVARRMQAQRQQKMLRERATGLTDKAKFALAEGREDLAEAAVSRQIDFETEATKLDGVIQSSDEEAARLAECQTALAERKSLMEDELRAFELAQRDAASAGGDGSTLGKREIEHRVARAEAAFNRAMDGTGVAGVSRADAKTAGAVAELDGLHKSSLVAERLEALRKAA
jgi:phage shock protein A